MGADWRFFWPENVGDFATFPSAWDSSLNTGIGKPALGSLWINSYLNFSASITKLGLDWGTVTILFWIIPAFVVSFISSFSLFNFFFKDKRFSIISGIIYSLNTYILLVISGGQLGIALAYSLIPLVFLRAINILKKATLKNSILAGLVFSLQIIFDPRIAFLSVIISFLYFLFNLDNLKKMKNQIFLLVPFLISLMLNFFWILPLVLTKSSGLPSEFNSASGFRFFSFADFSHTFSLLHPNWPENIFGKVYFLDPKFLILPMIAFTALLFRKDKNIIFFSALALLGIFMAKGANLPFGEVNVWLFQNIPGMSVFRDPTKWYILIALSYSILIPYSLLNIIRYVQSKTKFTNLVFLGIYAASFAYFLFLILPIFGQLKVREVPQEYVKLKDFLNNQKAFSRTLWIPVWQRYGFFSNNHPAIGREELYKGNARKQVTKLNETNLKELSVKYIIVPYDSESEIFLSDRKYNEKEYKDTVSRLQKLSWLKETQSFGKIKVFELSSYKDHFWSPSESLKIDYKPISTTEYKVKVKNAKSGNILAFSESFDKNWTAKDSQFTIQSSKFENINSFSLSRNGNYEFNVYYEPQRYVEAGFILSSITFLGLLVLLRFGNSLKK